jgi:peptide/nickel transport system substrate-binding protein
MPRRWSVRVLVLSAGIVAAAALFPGAATSAPTHGLEAKAAKPPPVQRLRLEGGSWGYPSPFAYVPRGPGLMHVSLMFDTLLWKDASGRLMPWLARSWQRSPTGFAYTFRLRPNVRWHDGRTLTSRDVAFTFEYMTTGPARTAVGLSGPLDMIRSVETPNATTVVFRLSRRYAPFPELIAGRVPIVPQHVWSDVRDPARFRDARAVMGSGPYRLAAYEEASGSYRYVANATYFLGRPVVRTLEFVPAPDQLLALRRGGIDAGAPGSEEGIPSGALKPFYDNKAFGVLQAPGEWNRALHFNHTRGFPYDNRTFRQAVAYAIDRPGLVKRILFGRGRAGSAGGLAPSHPMVAANLPAYAFNPVRARQLFTQMGLRDRDGDGLRELPNGQKFRPELLTASANSPMTAEIVKEQLRRVGLDVQLRSLDRAAADAATVAGRYDLALIGHGALGGDADQLRTRVSARVQSRSFFRVHGWRNARFEELGDAQLQTVAPNARRRFVHEMQRIVARELPMLSLYVPTRIHVYRKGVFSAWYYTPGGVYGAYPHPYNKHVFLTGKKRGL